MLFAVTITNGVIDIGSQSNDYAMNAAFDVIVHGEPPRRVLHDLPDSWAHLSRQPGSVQLVNRSAIPNATVLAAVGTLIFGVPTPPDLSIGQSTPGVLDLTFATQEDVSYVIEAAPAVPAGQWIDSPVMRGDGSILTVSQGADGAPGFRRARAEWDEGCIYSVHTVVSGSCPGVQVGTFLCVRPCPPGGQIECPPPLGNAITIVDASDPTIVNCLVQVSFPPLKCQPCNQAGTVRGRWATLPLPVVHLS